MKGRRRKKLKVESMRITPAQRRNFKLWLLRVLQSPRLEADTTDYPVARGRPVQVEIDGAVRTVASGQWNLTGAGLYVGKSEPNDRLSLVDRLAILVALINHHEVWDEDVIEAYSKALSSVMLDTYNSFLHGAIQSKAPATRLAFNEKQRKFAAYIEDGYYLSDGTEVDVTKEKGWTTGA